MGTKVDRTLFLVGLAVFLVALGLRLIGITWGLPNETRYHSLHPDEEVVYGFSQAIEPTKLKFTPGFYNYGTFYLTLEKVASDVVTAYGGQAKEDGSDAHLVMGRSILAGRVMSAIAGSLTALLVFLILVRRTHIVGAAMGAAALALTPGFVLHSRFQTVDVVAVCLLTAAIFFAVQVVPVGDAERTFAQDRKSLLLAGLFAGLSAGTKYTGILVMLAVLVVLGLVYLRANRVKEMFLLGGKSVAVALLTFLFVTPGMVADSTAFWRDFKYEMTHSQEGHGLVFAGTAPGFIFHIQNLVVGYGGLLLVISLFGLGRAVWRKHPWAIGLAAFFLVSYLLIGRAEVKFLRYTFPLLPPLAIGFGWLMGQGHLRGGPKFRGIVALGAVGLAGIGGGLLSTVPLTQFMAGEDVRDQAGRFFQRLPQETTVGLVSDPWFYTPTLYAQAQAGPMYGAKNRFEWMAQSQQPVVMRALPDDPRERFDWDISLLTAGQPDYVVFSSFETEGYARLERASAIPEEFKLGFDRYTAFLAQLKKDYDFVPYEDENGRMTAMLGLDGAKSTQGIHDLSYIRPILWIWKRKTLTTTPSSGSSTTSGSNEEPAGTR